MTNKTTFINPPGWGEFLNYDCDDESWGFDLTPEDAKKYCTHEWVNVSFMFEKPACKHCDILKSDWDKYQADKKAKEEADKNLYCY